MRSVAGVPATATGEKGLNCDSCGADVMKKRGLMSISSVIVESEYVVVDASSATDVKDAGAPTGTTSAAEGCTVTAGVSDGHAATSVKVVELNAQPSDQRACSRDREGAGEGVRAWVPQSLARMHLEH